IYDRVGQFASSIAKPWGVHESGFNNKNVNISSTSAYTNLVYSNPALQKHHMINALASLNEFGAKWIINWTPINFSPLVQFFETIGPDTADLAKIWENTGLRYSAIDSKSVDNSLREGVRGATSVN